jgi:hypothetical protein
MMLRRVDDLQSLILTKGHCFEKRPLRDEQHRPCHDAAAMQNQHMITRSTERPLWDSKLLTVSDIPLSRPGLSVQIVLICI